MDTNKQILQAYIGDRGYQQIHDNVQQYIREFKPENVTEQDFQNQLNFLMENSESPMFELTGFFTNNQKVVDENASLSDMLDFIKKETKRGDMNFLINIAKQEHIANNKLNNEAYRSKDDKVLHDLRVLFNERDGVVRQAFNDGLLKSIESNILRNEELKEFRNSTKAKAKNRVAKDIKDWDVLNESISYNPDMLPLLAYNPIGVKMDINNQARIITVSSIIGANADGYFIESVNDLSQEQALQVHPIMNAIVQQYVPKQEQFEMKNVYDFDVIINENINIVDTQLPVDKQEYIQITSEQLQDLLFESYNEAKEYVEDINQLNDIKRQSDNMLLIAKQHADIMVIDDLVEIINPTNKNSVIIEALKNTTNTEKIVDVRLQNKLDNVTPTYRKMVSSIMEILEPNQIQAENIMTYFADKIKSDIEKSEANKVKIDALKIELDKYTKSINEATKYMEIADQNSQIYKEKKKQLDADNKAYEKLLIEYKELREMNAYYN